MTTRFGRIVPVQCHILRLIGYPLTRGQYVGLDIPDEERLINMRLGQSSLHLLTGQNFEYDVMAWHDYLVMHPEFGYTHPYGFRKVKRAVQAAVNEPDR